MPGLVLRNFHTGSRACLSVSRFPFVTQDRESEPTTEPQSYFIFRVGLGLAPFSTRPARSVAPLAKQVHDCFFDSLLLFAVKGPF